jgi:hypothetical protein
MADKRLIIELTYSNRGDGNWSHQIDIFRQIEVEQLLEKEVDRPSEERLDADEIESLLNDATGSYGEAYKLMAADYVSFFDKLVSSMLKLPLGLTLHQYRGSEDYFVDADCVYATISQQTASALLKKSAKERHRELQSELSLTKEKLGALVRKPVSKWSAFELGALLASLIEDVEEVESDVFCSMAEGSDCFFADSAIDWKKYEAAAEKLRRSKKDDWEDDDWDEDGSTPFLRSLPRAIRLAPRSLTKHPCEGLSKAEPSTRWLPEASRLIPIMRSAGWLDSVISRRRAGSWITAAMAGHKPDTSTRYRSRCTWRGASGRGRLATLLEMSRSLRRNLRLISSRYSRDSPWIACARAPRRQRSFLNEGEGRRLRICRRRCRSLGTVPVRSVNSRLVKVYQGAS